MLNLFRFGSFSRTDRMALDESDAREIVEAAIKAGHTQALIRLSDIAQEQNWSDLEGFIGYALAGVEPALTPHEVFPHTTAIPDGISSVLAGHLQNLEFLERRAHGAVFETEDGTTIEAPTEEDGFALLETGDLKLATEIFDHVGSRRGLLEVGDAYLKGRRAYGASAHGIYMLAATLKQRTLGAAKGLADLIFPSRLFSEPRLLRPGLGRAGVQG